MIIVIVIVLCLNSIRCQPRLEAFVAQGIFSEIIDFPYSACLGISQPGENEMENLRVSWMCGSSILNQRLLLTAAHCVYKCLKSASILVQYGDENREKAMIMMVLRYLNHPGYSEVEPSRFDIALVMVKKTLILTERVGRVILLQNPPYNEMGLIAGWGYIDEIQQITSNTLRHTNQKIMNHAQCQKALGITLSKGLICGGHKKATSYPSRGDSGSALIVRGYIQVGIFSCKNPGVRSIGIYTDVGYYYSWINENALKFFCNDMELDLSI